MIYAEKEEFVRLLRELLRVLPGRVLDSELIDFYWDDLKRFQLETFRKAIVLCRQECKRFPTIADLFSACKRSIPQQSSTPCRYDAGPPLTPEEVELSRTRLRQFREKYGNLIDGKRSGGWFYTIPKQYRRELEVLTAWTLDEVPKEYRG